MNAIVFERRIQTELQKYESKHANHVYPDVKGVLFYPKRKEKCIGFYIAIYFDKRMVNVQDTGRKQHYIFSVF